MSAHFYVMHVAWSNRDCTSYCLVKLKCMAGCTTMTFDIFKSHTIDTLNESNESVFAHIFSAPWRCSLDDDAAADSGPFSCPATCTRQSQSIVSVKSENDGFYKRKNLQDPAPGRASKYTYHLQRKRRVDYFFFFSRNLMRGGNDRKVLISPWWALGIASNFVSILLRLRWRLFKTKGSPTWLRQSCVTESVWLVRIRRSMHSRTEPYFLLVEWRKRCSSFWIAYRDGFDQDSSRISSRRPRWIPSPSKMDTSCPTIEPLFVGNVLWIRAKSLVSFLWNEGNVACCLVFVLRRLRSGLPPRYALAKMEIIA
jgi:hypothetical protein